MPKRKRKGKGKGLKIRVSLFEECFKKSHSHFQSSSFLFNLQLAEKDELIFNMEEDVMTKEGKIASNEQRMAMLVSELEMYKAKGQEETGNRGSCISLFHHA